MKMKFMYQDYSMYKSNIDNESNFEKCFVNKFSTLFPIFIIEIAKLLTFVFYIIMSPVIPTKWKRCYRDYYEILKMCRMDNR